MNSHYESFKEQIELRFKAASTALDSAAWISKHTALRNKPYSFDKHEYQIAIANDKHRIVAAEKCAQIGFTEILLRWMISFLVQHQGASGIFTQPTAADMGNFAKSRVDAVFDESPIIKRLGTGGIDSAQLKKIGSSFLNLRGTFGTRAAISVPSDANIYDEVNFSNPLVLNQYKSRLQHSEYKLERYISTPTVPNYGVSDLVNRSDQKHLMLKCDKCGHQQTLDWPESIFIASTLQLGVDGEVDQDVFNTYLDAPYKFKPFYACKKCKRPVDKSWKYREWVAKYPERARDYDSGISGYIISQLDVEFVSATEVIAASDKRLDGYKRIEDFYNFVLGKAYAGGDSMKITDATKILATYIMQLEKISGTFVGIDLGNICHIVVVKDFWLPGRDMPTPIVVATKKIPKESLEDLLDIFNMYGMLYSVSDAQPYTTTVEKIANKIPHKMRICFFGGKKAYTISGSDQQVTAHRTQTLDAVTEDLSLARLLVSSSIDHFDEFWKHCKNLVKVKAEDDDGTTYYEYVKVGDDHFGYAFAYAMLARRIFFEERPAGLTGLAPVAITGAKVDL